jgi:hypothetical protein
MHFTRPRYSTVVPLILVLFLALLVPGCHNKLQPFVNGQDSFACSDQTVAIVPVDGTNPKAVYLCQNSKLTWVPNGHTFTITFPQKYPFQGAALTFANDPQNLNNPVTSPPAIYSGSLVVYTYTMTIDGKQVTDPQVVGGGQHSN